MLPSWADDTVTIVEPVWVGERGKRVATYPGRGVEVSGCSVQPGGSTTDRDGRINTVFDYVALLPAGTPVTRLAKIQFEGDDFKIEGRPNRWKSPTGAVSHVELRLIAWDG